MIHQVYLIPLVKFLLWIYDQIIQAYWHFYVYKPIQQMDILIFTLMYKLTNLYPSNHLDHILILANLSLF
jgi:hypothetical protein